MKVCVCTVGLIVALTSMRPLHAEQTSYRPDDCEEWLGLFVPEQADTSAIVMRAVADLTIHDHVPTRELKIQQLTEEYNESREHQDMFPNADAFVETMLRLLGDEDHNQQVIPERRLRVKLLISASNAYARYYGADDLHSPTQEVVQLSYPGHGERFITIDHIRKTITEKIEQHRNEFSSYFMALTPQEGHRSSWRLYPLLLRAENRSESLAQLLCAHGNVQLSTYHIGVRFIDESNVVFFTQMAVPKGVLETEYHLERGLHIRLMRYKMRGPELSTQVTYEYESPEDPWPKRQHLIDRNVLSEQTLQERTMHIVEVTPDSRWDFDRIYQTLMNKYRHYSNGMAELCNEDGKRIHSESGNSFYVECSG